MEGQNILARVEVIQKEKEKKKEEAESRKKIKRKAQRAFLQVQIKGFLCRSL